MFFVDSKQAGWPLAWAPGQAQFVALGPSLALCKLDLGPSASATGGSEGRGRLLSPHNLLAGTPFFSR